VNATETRVQRVAKLSWVPLKDIRVNPMAQRDLNQSRVDRLYEKFDPEQLGTPTTNHRDGFYYMIDGQHRLEALKLWLGDGWEAQHMQCWVYEGLTEEQEAEVFLKLNDTLAVQAFARYRVAVQAGRPDEVDVDRIVRECMLRVSQDMGDGAISAVGTLMRVYRRSDPATLARTLLIVRDSYGDPGLLAPVIDGLGLLVQRYNGRLDDAQLVTRLSKAHGGVSGLLGLAEQLKRQTGNPKAHCVAAAAIEINNRGRGGRKLPTWFRSDVQEQE
jgi:hypothetical protein